MFIYEPMDDNMKQDHIISALVELKRSTLALYAHKGQLCNLQCTQNLVALQI